MSFILSSFRKRACCYGELKKALVYVRILVYSMNRFGNILWGWRPKPRMLCVALQYISHPASEDVLYIFKNCSQIGLHSFIQESLPIKHFDVPPHIFLINFTLCCHSFTQTDSLHVGSAGRLALSWCSLILWWQCQRGWWCGDYGTSRTMTLTLSTMCRWHTFSSRWLPPWHTTGTTFFLFQSDCSSSTSGRAM